MKTLTKNQLAEKARLGLALHQAAQKVDTAIAAFNHVLDEAKAPVEQALEEYNDALRQAAEFCEEVASDQQSYFDDKSEKWQESDRGQEYQQWMNDWANVCLDEATVELPDEVEVPDLSAPDTLEDLPDEADNAG